MGVRSKLKGLKHAFTCAMRDVGAFLGLDDNDAEGLPIEAEQACEQATQRKKTNDDDGGGDDDGRRRAPSGHREVEPVEEHDAGAGKPEEVNYAVPLGMTQETFYAMKRRKEAEERMRKEAEKRMRKARTAQSRKRKPDTKRTVRRAYQRMGAPSCEIWEEADAERVMKSIAEKAGAPDMTRGRDGLSL